MKIVSKIKRRNGHTVTLGDTAYKFLPPDYAAEVTDKAHVERFLSIPEGYGIADGEVSTKAEQNIEPKRVESVEYVGSDVHPAAFEIGGKTIEQAVVVKLASGERTAEQWNAMPEGERADLIDEQLDKLAESPEGDLDGDGDLDREELAKLYEAKFGKRPHGKWSADRISEELKKDAE